jgi:hypothetical protein
MDDCFRCHGMHFNGSIRDLVQPLNTKGPWHLTRAGFADQPAMPCQACHQVHREGPQEPSPSARISVAGAPVHDSLAFFDRRESMHFASRSLAHSATERRRAPGQAEPGPAPGHLLPVPRAARARDGHGGSQASWGPQVGSGDDRTPMGVHEGISCISCHNGHNENARASCKTCHPQMSHCGLDVEKMDTTFASAASPHNIHWVKCADCHQHGIPKVKGSRAGQSRPVSRSSPGTPREYRKQGS